MNFLARFKIRLREPFVYFALFMILLGSGLRFNGLDRKQFWKDEASTSMISVGRCIYELFGEANGGTYAAGSFVEIQKSAPDRGLRNTFFRVASDESTHAPLYYLVLNVWIDVFGDSVRSIRGFSASLSLALIPAMYFLCLTLFRSSNAGWIGAAIAAVSPYQFLFAQEAREYILWLVMTVLSSVALLQERWRRYLFLCILDIYSSLFTVFVATGQMAFVYLNRKHDVRIKKKHSRFFWWSRTATLLLGVPIFANMLMHLPDIRRATAWMSTSPGFSKYARAILSGFYRVFFDLNLPTGATISAYPFQALTIASVLAVEAAAIFYFFRRADRKSRLFVAFLMASALLPTMGLDLVFGGRRALSARFLLTFYLALQLVVVFCLDHLFKSSSRKFRILGRSSAVLLSLLGLISISVNSQSDTWWNKGVTGDYRIMGKAVAEAPFPRLIISADYRESLAIARYVDPSTMIMSAPPFPKTDSLRSWKSVFVLFGDPDGFPDFYQKSGVPMHLISGKLWRLDL